MLLEYETQVDLTRGQTTHDPAGFVPGSFRKAFYDRFWAHSPFTCAFNASGCPAMSVPFGLLASGLPVGVHLGAGFGQDELLFSLAGQIERAAPWAHLRPRDPAASR